MPRNEAEIRSEMKELNEKEQRNSHCSIRVPEALSKDRRDILQKADHGCVTSRLSGGWCAVSEKHCGFVINKGDATAADICQLMRDVSDKVQAQFGVVLEPEVKMIGEF